MTSQISKSEDNLAPAMADAKTIYKNKINITLLYFLFPNIIRMMVVKEQIIYTYKRINKFQSLPLVSSKSNNRKDYRIKSKIIG